MIKKEYQFFQMSYAKGQSNIDFLLPGSVDAENLPCSLKHTHLVLAQKGKQIHRETPFLSSDKCSHHLPRANTRAKSLGSPRQRSLCSCDLGLHSASCSRGRDGKDVSPYLQSIWQDLPVLS